VVFLSTGGISFFCIDETLFNDLDIRDATPDIFNKENRIQGSLLQLFKCCKVSVKPNKGLISLELK